MGKPVFFQDKKKTNFSANLRSEKTFLNLRTFKSNDANFLVKILTLSFFLTKHIQKNFSTTDGEFSLRDFYPQTFED